MNKYMKLLIIVFGIFVISSFYGCSGDSNQKDAKNKTESNDESSKDKENKSIKQKDLIEVLPLLKETNMNCEIEIKTNVDGKEITQNGKLWIKDEKTKYEFSSNSISMIVFTDFEKDELLTYMKSANMAIKTKIPKVLDDVVEPYRIIQSIKDEDIKKFEKKESEKVDGIDCFVYEGTVKSILSNGLDVADASIKIYLQKEDNMIKKCEIKSGDEVKFEMVIKSLETGKVKDEMVSVDIPENVEVKEG